MTRAEAVRAARELMRVAQWLLGEEAVDENKAKTGVSHNGSDSEPRVWTCSRGQKGKVPSFVLAMTGLSNKYDVMKKYGDGARFIEGAAIPSEIGGDR